MKFKKIICVISLVAICACSIVLSVNAANPTIFYNCDATNAGATARLTTSNGGAGNAEASFKFGGLDKDSMTTEIIASKSTRVLVENDWIGKNGTQTFGEDEAVKSISLTTYGKIWVATKETMHTARLTYSGKSTVKVFSGQRG